MRQARKREILDFIESLHQAHSEMKEAIERHEMASVQTMLAECQEFAVELGNAIEDTEGEDCVTVSHVENYCETLFRIYEELNGLTWPGVLENQKNICDSQKVYKILKKQLLKVENSLKNDITIRKEIVFLPYKASMWDSLESVYLAAKEDPDCDAYCVPIPYFVRNADGSVGEMHYEGGEYPDNIEIIDYRTYDLEGRHPDVVYIHNPYDECNHVTCVPEKYFAKNLRNYTDCLVYIPYFILNEIEPDDYDAIEDIKHFCFLPGTLYAHKVIVQSEKLREIYITEFIKQAKELGLRDEYVDRNSLEAKILGLGSPKFDKALKTKKKELQIPDEWYRIIKRQDGSWKKIIFYNTSINALLHNDERVIEKIRSVFRLFKEEQQNIALLWRPHPLIQSTIQSMRPQLWIEYSKLVEWYCSERWGIYDDSADLDRAITLSDAYYGDQSSVVQLFRRIGKPVMIQNADVFCI